MSVIALVWCTVVMVIRHLGDKQPSPVSTTEGKQCSRVLLHIANFTLQLDSGIQVIQVTNQRCIAGHVVDCLSCLTAT